jgi:hypothetical protein
MRTRRQFPMSVESLEGKTLLSALPVLSQGTFNQVLHQVDQAAGTFAKTHNENGFIAKLSQISYRIPYGHSQLFPAWESDAAIYNQGSPGSGVTMVNQLKTDLVDYVQTAVGDGEIAVRGSWLARLTDPGSGAAPTPVLTQHTLNQVEHQIDQAAGTLAKTHNENAFAGRLAQISYEIPYGHTQLLPTWQSDMGIYDPSEPGSGVMMVGQLKSDLLSYVHTAVASGTIIYK